MTLGELHLMVDGCPYLQPVTEASYVNIPVIAFCNTNTPLKNIDVAIPCNSNVSVQTRVTCMVLIQQC